ncbi:hypothetical protein [Amycolatopsis sp. GM8]|uniref:hypothetical protein n=1 Tax=Amycolatopsis sp. GM8 TaxID=2896530 RepID=UPI001F3DFC65|nr:hypothetical protein [Amycolatopsis sp. GM8]
MPRVRARHRELRRDDPEFPNWDQDRTAVEDDDAAQDPEQVAAELADAPALLAEGFAAVPDSAWTRTGSRSDGAQFTVDTFARYFIHDPVHHLHDVRG